MRTRAMACLVGALVSGCASLPELTFEDDGGGVDATAATDSGGSDSTTGGGETGTGSSSGGSEDGGVDASDGGVVFAVDGAGCPDAAPAGASMCCGAVACVGMAKKCQTACTNCMDTCNAGQTCCLAPNGDLNGCFGSPSECP